MLMNRVETALVNSPPRRVLQRFYETPTLLRLGGMLPTDARVLEVGCGAGYGTELILRRFAAARVDALDLDPAMVARSKRRLAGYGDRVRLATGDMTDLRSALGAEDGSYDAVFDFAIVHHVPDWRAALAEIVRVLAPGGRLLYVTCSVLAAENDAVVSRFLETSSDAAEDAVLPNNNIRDLMRRKACGYQILPGTAGMDGFYFACLVKKVS